MSDTIRTISAEVYTEKSYSIDGGLFIAIDILNPERCDRGQAHIHLSRDNAIQLVKNIYNIIK